MLTSLLRRLFERLRADGAFSLQVFKTALATSLAYEVGRLTASPYPVFAALAAMLVVQVTIFDSVSRGLQRVGGVVVGVLTAYLIAQLLGLHAWTIGLVTLLALGLGKSLRLGDGGAVQVPVSALLVMTVGTSSRYVEDRILETVLGAVVGIIVNVAVVPPTRTRDAGRAVGALADALAGVLSSAGEGLQHDTWVDEAADWLDDARALRPVVTAAATAVDRAETSLRLNPKGTRLIPAARRRRVALRALEHVAVQVRGITRTLLDAADHPNPGQADRAPARRAAGVALAAVAAALRAYAAVAREPEAHDSSPEVAALRDALATARGRLSSAAQTAHDVPTWNESGWLIYGALLTDVDRILDELDGKSQAELLAARLLPRADPLQRMLAVSPTRTQRRRRRTDR